MSPSYICKIADLLFDILVIVVFLMASLRPLFATHSTRIPDILLDVY